MSGKFDLSRFKEAHENSYETALKEIKQGRKTSHWMWYIFPQMHGLGCSQISKRYAISSAEEAKAFLDDEYLGGNLKEISNALMQLDTNDASYVFGFPDDKKLRSCMTLFAYVSEEGSVFHKVLEKYFGGKQDPVTINIIKSSNQMTQNILERLEKL